MYRYSKVPLTTSSCLLLSSAFLLLLGFAGYLAFLHRHHDIILNPRKTTRNCSRHATSKHGGFCAEHLSVLRRTKDDGDRRNLATDLATRPATRTEQITATMSRPGGAQYDMQIKVRKHGLDAGAVPPAPSLPPGNFEGLRRAVSVFSPPPSVDSRIPPSCVIALVYLHLYFGSVWRWFGSFG